MVLISGHYACISKLNLLENAYCDCLKDFLVITNIIKIVMFILVKATHDTVINARSFQT